MNIYVYILECSDGSYYTGVTNNLERRLYDHNNDEDTRHYTYSRRPVKLVYTYHFTNPDDAILHEKKLKKWSRQKKKALINGDIDLLKSLSCCRNKSHSRYLFDASVPPRLRSG